MENSEYYQSEKNILIDIAQQLLILREKGKEVECFSVSTGKNGAGEQSGSGCTPRGWHQIRAKIGEGCPINSVFVGRRPTGEIYTPELGKVYPNRDWILTRILWLSGLEIGYNRLGAVDTMRRYIYIHGTPNEESIGTPVSHGCIRLHHTNLLALFDWASVKTPVFITEVNLQ